MTDLELESIRELSILLHEVLLETSRTINPGSNLMTLRNEALSILALKCPEAELYSFDMNINETVCHGKSAKDRVAEGDIITLDLVICRNNLFADEAWSSICGEGSSEYKALLQKAWEISRKAVLSVKSGETSFTMKKEIHNALAGSGFSLIEEACGHGIGLKMHLSPDINFSLLNKDDVSWTEGMVFTIEPVISLGGAKLLHSKEKEWITDNREASAYFEHMVAISSTGVECLNIPKINKLNSIDIFRQII
ncbi:MULTISPECIES: M24 family metallopeptidase [unclassified Oceanispirochaeta]|uniref:M24 family metallopeptidase n=1 Tax=unclassified Oceanispirochaeta TaxID=2635722 RepID=UPI000E09C929|nr:MULTISPECIES: M24 family metallopeptidase [unclassified Oceanispirochaeta]MBF9016100.1 M24 family metallopeptidase [Oceanispirochaeta sp. M2]NPD72563.1 M24 family metallopeptidase [Oceanispirochaeta sp. M1]RDG32018.1 M24 family metallopeptidase [Oceanispirochaeta sp. M1]